MQERLKEYIDEDEIYKLYKQDRLHSPSDFEEYCIQHCKDIEQALYDIKSLQHQLEEKEEYINIMSEAFDELKMQKQDYTQINILEMKLKEKDKVIDETIKSLNKYIIFSSEDRQEYNEKIVRKTLEILERGKNGKR